MADGIMDVYANEYELLARAAQTDFDLFSGNATSDEIYDYLCSMGLVPRLGGPDVVPTPGYNYAAASPLQGTVDNDVKPLCNPYATALEGMDYHEQGFHAYEVPDQLASNDADRVIDDVLPPRPAVDAVPTPGYFYTAADPFQSVMDYDVKPLCNPYAATLEDMDYHEQGSATYEVAFDPLYQLASDDADRAMDVLPPRPVVDVVPTPDYNYAAADPFQIAMVYDVKPLAMYDPYAAQFDDDHAQSFFGASEVTFAGCSTPQHGHGLPNDTAQGGGDQTEMYTVAPTDLVQYACEIAKQNGIDAATVHDIVSQVFGAPPSPVMPPHEDEQMQFCGDVEEAM